MDFKNIFNDIPEAQKEKHIKADVLEEPAENAKKLYIETLEEPTAESPTPLGSFSYQTDDGDEIEGQIGFSLDDNGELKATIYSKFLDPITEIADQIDDITKAITEQSIMTTAKFLEAYRESPEIYDLFYKEEYDENAIAFIESLTDDEYKLLDLEAQTVADIKKATGENKIIAFLDIFNSPVDRRLPDFYKDVIAGRGKNPDDEINTIVRTPDNFIYDIDRVSKGVFNGDIQADGVERYIQLSKKSTKRHQYKDIGVGVSLYSNVDQIENLNLFDRAVYDAINTEFEEAENEVTTIAKIYRTMIGKKSSKTKVPANIEKEILASIIKMQAKTILINKRKLTEWGIVDDNDLTYLLPVEIKTRKINGVMVKNSIEKIKKLPLYKLADQLDQVQRTPLKVLDTPVRKDKEAIMLQRYLYERVLQAKSTGKNSIVLDTIYDALGLELGTDKKSRDKKTKLLNKIEELLFYWSTPEIREACPNSGIYGYKICKKGKSYYNIELYLTEKDKKEADKRRKKNS